MVNTHNKNVNESNLLCECECVMCIVLVTPANKYKNGHT